MPAKPTRTKNLRDAKKKTIFIFPPKRKTASSKTKKRYFYFIFATAIFAFFSLVLGSKIYNFIKISSVSAFKNGALDDAGSVFKGENINIAVVRVRDQDEKNSEVKGFYLVNINQDSYKYRVYSFPVNEEFKAYLGEDSLALKDIYKIGNEDGRVFKDYLQKFVLRQFAIGINGYVVVDDEGYKKIVDAAGGNIHYEDLSSLVRLKNTLNLPSMVTTFIDNAQTNFSTYDVIKFLTFVKSTSENSSAIKDTGKFALTDVSVWDNMWQEKFVDTNILKEQKKLLVINASQNPKIPGLASWGARVAENFGMGVLDMQNALSEYDEDIVVTNNPELFSVTAISKAFNVTKVHHLNDYLNRFDINPLIKNSDITLILTSL